MPEENVEIVRRAYAAVERGDLDAMSAELAPGFHFTPTSAYIGDRAAPGIEGFRAFLEAFWREFDASHIELRKLLDATGGRVVTWTTVRGRGARSGVESSLDLWHVWEVRDGQIASGRAFTTKEQALEAAGLSE